MDEINGVPLEEIEAAVIEHLDACLESMFALEEAQAHDLDIEVNSPALAPFCGCDDCYRREVLYSAFRAAGFDIG